MNPEHLWLGTAKDNADDMVSKNRSYSPCGASNPKAKLSEDDVSTMRTLSESHGSR